jgi:prophage antirepressor-like protein
MNELQIFKNDEFGEIRILMRDGEPWFVASDICKVLELSNITETLKRVDEDELSITEVIDSLGRRQQVYIVNEAGLYNLILLSRKSEAKKFKRWITHEVLPSIRKHGAYLTPEKIEEVLLNPDTIIQLAQQLKEEKQKRLEAEKTIQIMKPKAEFFDAVAGSKDAIDMNRAAKLIYEETRMGRNKLFKLLREKGVLMKDNIPYQEYIDKGYFRTIEQKYTKPDGTTHIYIKTLVYQKGLDFIRKVIKEDNVIALKRA